MKKRTFSATAMLRLGLTLLLFLSNYSCQQDDMVNDALDETTTAQTVSDMGSGGEVTGRSVSNCECEYLITDWSFSGDPLSNHAEFFLSGDEAVCDGGCRYFSAAYVDCQEPFSDPDCDTYITTPDDFYRFFHCSVPPNSSFGVGLDPYWLSSPIACSQGSSMSGYIKFRVRCREKPLDNCSSGTFASNIKTITLPAVTASVVLGGCGCEPTIY